MNRLLEAVRDENALLKLFKGPVFEEGLGKGSWTKADRGNGFQLALADGSIIKLKFFNTVKQITNSKLQIVPGRESYLSYIDVSTLPVDNEGKRTKGFTFKLDIKQYPWLHARAKAEVVHNVCLQNLKDKAAKLGLSLDEEGSFETYYVGKM